MLNAPGNAGVPQVPVVDGGDGGHGGGRHVVAVHPQGLVRTVGQGVTAGAGLAWGGREAG